MRRPGCCWPRSPEADAATERLTQALFSAKLVLNYGQNFREGLP